MKLRAVHQKYTLDFRFEAGTSRGTLTQRNTYFIKIYDLENPSLFGIGECAPLQGLSIDDVPNYETKLKTFCNSFNHLDLEVFSWNLPIIVDQIITKSFPSIQFGFETALHDYLNGGKRQIFVNHFSESKKAININGLIWMGKRDFMLEQIQEKIAAGFKTLKMKIGAIEFDNELSILESIRKEFDANQMEIRVDANGAFAPKDAINKLNALAAYQLHSIEQPIKPKQIELMKKLCRESPIAIALDEELIGVSDYMAKLKLLKNIMPQYIILKPSLLGGFSACKEWIELANRFGIKWWITSALESNIGLNAIAQFTAQFDNVLPQGLGTGQLYHNNVASPLQIQDGTLMYNQDQIWNLDEINNSFVMLEK
jgi:o-succinylbenzoate synthase